MQYYVSTDKTKLNIPLIHHYLSKESYWAQNIPLEILVTAIENSVCFGVYTSDDEQVGFARLITDMATFTYLADVFILEAHRGKGLSKLLMKHIHADERFSCLRRWLLVTRDAQKLYEQFGWTYLNDEQLRKFMQIHRSNAYTK